MAAVVKDGAFSLPHLNVSKASNVSNVSNVSSVSSTKQSSQNSYHIQHSPSSVGFLPVSPLSPFPPHRTPSQMSPLLRSVFDEFLTPSPLPSPLSLLGSPSQSFQSSKHIQQPNKTKQGLLTNLRPLVSTAPLLCVSPSLSCSEGSVQSASPTFPSPLVSTTSQTSTASTTSQTSLDLKLTQPRVFNFHSLPTRQTSQPNDWQTFDDFLLDASVETGVETNVENDRVEDQPCLVDDRVEDTFSAATETKTTLADPSTDVEVLGTRKGFVRFASCLEGLSSSVSSEVIQSCYSFDSLHISEVKDFDLSYVDKLNEDESLQEQRFRNRAAELVSSVDNSPLLTCTKFSIQPRPSSVNQTRESTITQLYCQTLRAFQHARTLMSNQFELEAPSPQEAKERRKRVKQLCDLKKAARMDNLLCKEKIIKYQGRSQFAKQRERKAGRFVKIH